MRAGCAHTGDSGVCWLLSPSSVASGASAAGGGGGGVAGRCCAGATTVAAGRGPLGPLRAAMGSRGSGRNAGPCAPVMALRHAIHSDPSNAKVKVAEV